MKPLDCDCGRKVHNRLDCGVPIPRPPEEHASIPVSELAELREDRNRLDWLEARRVALNKYCGSTYGWHFVASHNVTRLFVRDVNTIDLHDSQPLSAGGADIRRAIDRAIEESRLK